VTAAPRLLRGADDRWTVHVSRHGGLIHVTPSRGLMSTGNWALSTNPKRSTSLWSVLTGAYLRREYPKTDKQLAKSIALCQEWCDRTNAYEAQQEARIRRVMQEQP
jgi:hypothetical protein